MGKVKANAAIGETDDIKVASNVTSISAARPKPGKALDAGGNNKDATFEAALVVFGRDESGKAHASAFRATDADLAMKAAGLMKFRVLPILNDDHRAAALGLPVGRVFASGRAFSPYAKEAAYVALEAFSEAFQPPAPVEPEPAPPPSVTGTPQRWEDIGVGALVLASTGPDEGWFEAIITEAREDSIFVLRWQGWPEHGEFVRRADGLALLPLSTANAA